MQRLVLPALALAAVLLTQCQKNDPDPASHLPPATQTGANQVGCLVNGQPWVPVGGGSSQNFQVDYDPTLGQGVFDLRVYKFTGASTPDEYLILFANPFAKVGSYDLGDPLVTNATLSLPKSSCYYNSRDAGTFCRGMLTITRLDPQVGIISGTFAFTLAKPGCDTIKITQGRFDKKL